MARRTRSSTVDEAADSTDATESAEATDATVGRSGLSRRVLLTRGSLTMVAAGVVSAMPAMPAAVNEAEVAAPDAESLVSDTDALDGPLVAQVKNLHTGEVSLFSGDREISVFDRGLAARLFNAAK
jgi:hypothetical protein